MLNHIREFLITTPFRCLKLSTQTDTITGRERYSSTNPNGLCGLIILFQLWERTIYLAAHPDCTNYIVQSVDLDIHARRNALICFAQGLITRNTTAAKEDFRRCTRAMLQWLTRHYPRTSITRRPPILPRDFWYCASFYINISLPGVPFTFFAADPTISNTFRDQPPHLHYLTAQIHHAAPSDQTGFFRFPDIHSMASTGLSDFQFAENHFFPLGMQLPSQRPNELEEALSELSKQILFLHRSH